MAKKKVTKRRSMDLVLDCRCGAKACVFELEKGYMAHCPGCGSLTFFHNPQLLERLRFGGQLCPHQLGKNPCPGGTTTWCPICRVRTFYRDR
jgi:hypothetical protein